MKILQWLVFALFQFLVIQATFAFIGPVLIMPNQANDEQKKTSFRTHLILDQQAIQESQANSLSELLANFAGLNILDSVGSPANVYMRGNYPQHMLISIDGISVNDPTSPNKRSILEYLNINDIEKIIIIPGTSLATTSPTIAGEIQIKTKSQLLFEQMQSSQEDSDIKVNLHLTQASFADNLSSEIYRFQQQNLFYFNASMTHSDGQSAKIDNAEIDSSQAKFKKFSYAKQISENKKFLLSFKENNFNQDYDGCYDTSFNLTNDCQSEYFNQEFNTQIIINQKKWQHQFIFDWQKLNRKLKTKNQLEGQYQGNISQIKWQAKTNEQKSINHLLGIDLKNENIEEIYLPFNQQNTFISPYYSINIVKDNQMIDLGLRYQSFTQGQSSLNEINTHLAYQIALNDNWAINTSLAKSSNSPSAYQLFSDYGNKNLRAEKAQYAQLAFLYQNQAAKNPIKMDLRFYDYKIKDFIGFKNNQYQNLDQVMIQGIDYFITHQFKDWQIQAGLSYNLAYQDAKSKKQLARRPKKMAQLSLSKQIDKFNFRLDHFYKSKWYDLDSDNDYLDGYVLTDFSVIYKPVNTIKNLVFRFKVNNIFAKKVVLLKDYAGQSRNYSFSIDFSF